MMVLAGLFGQTRAWREIGVQVGDVKLDGQRRRSHLVLPGSTVWFTWLVNPISISLLYHISYILAMPFFASTLVNCIFSITWGSTGEKPGFWEKPGFFPRIIEMIL
jgi:hypothetical protein